MRYITVILTPTDAQAWLKNQQQIQGGDDDRRQMWIDGTLVATQEAMNYVNLLDDGTAVGIGRFRGNADRLAAIESEIPEIMFCTVAGGETWLAYLQYEPDDLERALLELIDTEAISINWPITYTAEGMELTLFGEETALQQMIAAIPEEINLTLKRAGDYQPEMDDPACQLTDRQKEIVRAATEAGYYDIPRRATQRDLATELGVSRGTIGEHLRRAEAKIIQSVVV